MNLDVLGGTGTDGRPIALHIRDGLQVDDAHVSGPAATIDATGLTVAPGLIDLQVNGAHGIDISDEPQRMWEVGDALARHGVTAFCPTLVSAPEGDRALAAAALADRPDDYHGAVPIGLHIEGPFLSSARRGTHDPSRIAAAAGPIDPTGVAIVTLAPEVPGAMELVTHLCTAGVVVSIGHSEAPEAIVRAALDAGATMVTHLFNAMPAMTARDPGVAGVALTDERVALGVIADGHHVADAMLTLADRAAPGRVILVSDAMAAAGLGDGTYPLAGTSVTVADGLARNPEGKLAGAAATLERCVAHFAGATGCGLEAAIAAASIRPATVVGRTDMGRIRPGARGDVVLLDGWDVVCTIIGGTVAHLTDPARRTAHPAT